MRYYDDDHRPPAADCELPEPVRDPEELMQTATCQHGTLFLLVDRYLDPEKSEEIGEEWIEAHPYWDACNRNDQRITDFYDDYPYYYRENF